MRRRFDPRRPPRRLPGTVGDCREAPAEPPSDAELERRFGRLDKTGLRAAFEQREHLMNTYRPDLARSHEAP